MLVSTFAVRTRDFGNHIPKASLACAHSDTSASSLQQCATMTSVKIHPKLQSVVFGPSTASDKSRYATLSKKQKQKHIISHAPTHHPSSHSYISENPHDEGHQLADWALRGRTETHAVLAFLTTHEALHAPFTAALVALVPCVGGPTLDTLLALACDLQLHAHLSIKVGCPKIFG